MNTLKKYNIIDILIILYVFTISYLKIGINILYYSFTFSDIILGILSIIYIYKLIKKKINLNKTFKNFLLLYILFFTSLLISLISTTHIKFSLIELLPYIYSSILLLIVFLYISEKKEDGLKIIYFSSFFSFLLISTLGIISLFSMYLHNLFFIVSAEKYIFLTKLPNQLSVFLLISYYIFLINHDTWIKKIKFGILLDILFSALLITSQILTQSRIGFFLSIILVLYTFIKKIRISLFFKTPKKMLIYLMIGATTLFIFYNGIIMLHKKFNLLDRPLSTFKNMKLLDDFRSNQNKLAINTFTKHPINGIGIGNYRFIYPEHKQEIHNTFLTFLVETGIIGFIPFLSLFIFILIQIKKFKMKKFLNYSIILICFSISLFYHHIFRQRWVWIFLAFIISDISLRSNNIGLDKKNKLI